MIRGRVTDDREIVIGLTVIGRAGRRSRIEAEVDTGYDGWLYLPPLIVTSLGFPWRRRELATLGDGSTTFFDVFEGTVIWSRRQLLIPIDEANAMPLVGTALLDGCELNARFEPGGEVTIRPLRRRRSR